MHGTGGNNGKGGSLREGTGLTAPMPAPRPKESDFLFAAAADIGAPGPGSIRPFSSFRPFRAFFEAPGYVI